MVNQEKKSALTRLQKSIIFLCTIIYFTSYITRKNYAAVIVEFINETGISMDNASLALTGHAIFYGVGQLISGFLGDKIKPKFLMACGLFTTACMNFIFPFCSSVPILTAVWCINGLAQAMMWPPIVRTLSFAIPKAEDYKRATAIVSYGCYSATVLLYLCAPVCINLSGWRILFYISASVAAVMAVATLLFMPTTENVGKKESKNETENVATKISPKKFPFVVFGFIMLVILLQGIIRDGVSDWLPTYLENQFEISSSVAILLGVAPPLFAIFCTAVVTYLSNKVFKNELLFVAVLFAMAFLASLALSFFSGANVVLSAVLSTLITGTMHGANFFLICVVPQYFKNTGKVSFVSGLLNCCTYAGSALSGYGFALLATFLGWGGTIVGWAIICGVATAICFAIARGWNAFKKQTN